MFPNYNIINCKYNNNFISIMFNVIDNNYNVKIPDKQFFTLPTRESPQIAVFNYIILRL